MTQRFTIDGGETLENDLAYFCSLVRDAVLRIIPERSIDALLLGGGYGRGEGGVLRTPSGDKPYNDLEFYILVAGPELLNSRRYRCPIEHLAHELTSNVGIEVEFKLLSLRKLQRSPVTMFYYDLISGHRLVHGCDAWLAHCEHHRAAHRIPLHEATRLLFNRCSGLLFSQEKLTHIAFTASDADFVGRNLAKAKLALGDVILTMRGQYHWSCRERHKRLRKLEAEGALQEFTWVVPMHAQGVEFKIHPVRSTQLRSELATELERLKERASSLWLTLESRRLGVDFPDLYTYSHASGSKTPESNPLKNRLINLRRAGLSGILDPVYPRERLLRCLPLLLWDQAAAAEHRDILRFLQEQLQTSARSYSDLVSAYEALWKVYN